MTALICGSMAYDTIMVFTDQFKNHILPEQVHILNVSFLVPELRREFGGCAGNIAYNLNLLGSELETMATVGKDFVPYADWMEQQGMSQKYIRVVDDAYTAQAYITTDLDDNQITAFHPGAMSFSHQQSVTDAAGISIGIVSPDGKEGMQLHAQEFASAGIPFIFDPGQGLPMFDGSELLDLVALSEWVALNDYEARLMEDRTGLSPEQLAERVSAVIVTRGSKGSQIYTQGQCIEIPPVNLPKESVLDPTGCGDAYRAGLLYGLMQGYDWEVTGRIASLMGAIKVASKGTQNHAFSMEEFHQRYRDTFGSDF